MFSSNEIAQPLTAVTNSNLGTRQQVKQANDLVAGVQYTFAFTAMSHDNWLQTLTGGVGQFLFFPSLAAMAIFKAGLYLYDLIKSKNKNLGKVASFIREAIAATIITTAIIFSFFTATILATITPMLFIGALGLNALYNMGAAAYTGYKWATTDNPNERLAYKQNCIKHAIGAAIASTVTVGVGLMMVAKIAPVAMSIMNAVINGAGFLLGAFGAIQQYRARKQQEVAEKLKVEAQRTRVENPDEEDLELTHQQKHDQDLIPENATKEITASVTPLISKSSYPTLGGYFFSKKRDVEIERYSKQKNRQTYLVNEIDAKLDQLHHDHKYKSTTIRNKETALTHLKEIIQNDDSTVLNFKSLLNHSIFTSKTANPLQSFLRQEGDVQNIFKTAEKYYNYKP